MLPLQIAVVLVLIASGVLLLAALRLSRKLRLELAHHVSLVAEQSLAELKEMPGFPISVRLAWINQAARRVFSIGVPYLWGMQSSGMKLLGIGAAAGGGVWVLGYLDIRTFGLDRQPAGCAGILPRASQIFEREQRRAEQQFLEQLPSAIDMIVRMVRAGLTGHLGGTLRRHRSGTAVEQGF